MSEGWTSFWSFVPDWMIGMNSSFYTWKNGNLYKHNINEQRNTFYGVSYPSSITTIFNQDAFEVKMFKTLQLSGTHAWTADIITDLSTGIVDDTFFVEKENMWYAHIRRPDTSLNPNDVDYVSTQGIGSLSSYDAATQTITFTFDIGTSISIGDQIYTFNGSGGFTNIGDVASHTSNTITIGTVVNVPTAGQMVGYVKNAQAESYGSRGYYMQVELQNNDLEEVELYSVYTQIFKSYP